MTHIIQFQALGIEAKVGDHIDYKDCGVVDYYWNQVVRINKEARADLHANVPESERTYKQRRHNKSLAKKTNSMRPHGCCHSWRVGGESFAEAVKRKTGQVYIRTFIEEGLPVELTIMGQGHEETHALLKLDKINLLKRVLQENDIKSRTLTQLPKEAICDIGGIYALSRLYSSYAMIPLPFYAQTEDARIANDWIYDNSNGRIRLIEPAGVHPAIFQVMPVDAFRNVPDMFKKK